MTKIDQLIEKFKEFKEELNKNMNGAMNPGMHKPNATTGTSGGQGGMYKDLDGAGGGQDMQMIKFDKNGQWKLDKVDPQENINIPHPQGKAKMANGVNKGDSYLSTDGKNREANPKLRASDLGPGGKVHMVKDEGTNEESNPTKPHNKEKFKVMDPVKEKEEKHAATTGLPYSGKDKDVKKGEECPKCHADPCKCVDKSQMGHIQGNESKGNDENKAPGRGSLSV